MVAADREKPRMQYNHEEETKSLCLEEVLIERKKAAEFSPILEMCLTEQSSDNQLTLNISYRKPWRCYKYWGFQNTQNHETSAASIIYGLYTVSGHRNVLTFDCGGGNFDMFILFISDQIFKGIPQLETSICPPVLKKHLKKKYWLSVLLLSSSESIRKTSVKGKEPAMHITCECTKGSLSRTQSVRDYLLPLCYNAI